jgi:hypothetical protein
MMAVSRAMQADDHHSRLARKLGASSAIRPDLIGRSWGHLPR